MPHLAPLAWLVAPVLIMILMYYLYLVYTHHTPPLFK